eukprot:3304272-Amphidinium_carterae.1
MVMIVPSLHIEVLQIARDARPFGVWRGSPLENQVNPAHELARAQVVTALLCGRLAILGVAHLFQHRLLLCVLGWGHACATLRWQASRSPCKHSQPDMPHLVKASTLQGEQSEQRVDSSVAVENHWRVYRGNLSKRRLQRFTNE